MEIKILELEDTNALIVFRGEGHTYMNALIDELLRDPDVDVAKYNMEFQFSDPELLITTKGGKSPLNAVIEAAGRLAAYCDDLISQLESASG